MSGSLPIAAGAGAGAGSRAAGWHVRRATAGDVAAAAVAVGELLRELGSAPPALPAMEATAHGLLDPQVGALFVAESDGSIVGVLAASWQSAMHVPGRYALIQDLWVHPSWRAGGVGAALLAALFGLAQEQGLARVEVGLPGARFAGLAATEAFYIAHGFTVLGTRMRRGLA